MLRYATSRCLYVQNIAIQHSTAQHNIYYPSRIPSLYQHIIISSYHHKCMARTHSRSVPPSWGVLTILLMARECCPSSAHRATQCHTLTHTHQVGSANLLHCVLCIALYFLTLYCITLHCKFFYCKFVNCISYSVIQLFRYLFSYLGIYSVI
jgi:hypothetical protein